MVCGIKKCKLFSEANPAASYKMYYAHSKMFGCHTLHTLKNNITVDSFLQKSCNF